MFSHKTYVFNHNSKTLIVFWFVSYFYTKILSYLLDTKWGSGSFKAFCLEWVMIPIVKGSVTCYLGTFIWNYLLFLVTILILYWIFDLHVSWFLYWAYYSPVVFSNINCIAWKYTLIFAWNFIIEIFVYLARHHTYVLSLPSCQVNKFACFLLTYKNFEIP